MSTPKKILVFTVLCVWGTLSVFTLFHHKPVENGGETETMFHTLQVENGLATFEIFRNEQNFPEVDFRFPAGSFQFSVPEAAGYSGIRGLAPLHENRLALSFIIPHKPDTLVIISPNTIHITEYALALNAEGNCVAHLAPNTSDEVDLVISDLDGRWENRTPLPGLNPYSLKSLSIVSAYFENEYFHLNTPYGNIRKQYISPV